MGAIAQAAQAIRKLATGLDPEVEQQRSEWKREIESLAGAVAEQKAAGKALQEIPGRVARGEAATVDVLEAERRYRVAVNRVERLKSLFPKLLDTAPRRLQIEFRRLQDERKEAFDNLRLLQELSTQAEDLLIRSKSAFEEARKDPMDNSVRLEWEQSIAEQEAELAYLNERVAAAQHEVDQLTESMERNREARLAA